MNKKAKIAVAAVSVVMAGTMAFGMFGCGGSKSTSGVKGNVNLDNNNCLTYAKDTVINLNVGNKSDPKQAPSYNDGEIAGTVTLPDGKSYNQGDLKPAWKALQDKLNVVFNDKFLNVDSNKQLTNPIDSIGGKLEDFDIITASASAITENTSYLVDLNQYLDYMPNYKAFLEANPVTRWSLTSNTTNGAMYYAPYYDGNDDIEKYCMTEFSWIEGVLDVNQYDSTVTYAQQASSKKVAVSSFDKDITDKDGKPVGGAVAGDLGSCVGTVASVQSYMGKTGSWTVATSKPGDTSEVPQIGYVKVDYDAVIAALSNENEGVGKALKDAGVTTIDKSSGNIVDLQNQAINATNGAVTGGQLLKLTQEYIKVAYKYSDTENGTYAQAYTKLSDVFLSTSAAWDVDMLVGVMRCVVTNPLLINGSVEKLANIYGISARQATTQRRVDLTSLAGELYGVRGLESRYEYMYVGADGKIHDARLNAESYDLVSKMSAMAAEGLLYTGTYKMDGVNRDSKSHESALMMHDYSNTQSKGNWAKGGSTLAPISTPVSKWDTNDDGSHETVMRFTESWRSVKNTGFCLTKAGAASNKDKLSACLAFIDYMFSNDGQLLMTYGPMSTTGNTNPDGWWYGTEGLDISANLDKVELIAPATSYAPAQYRVKAKADGSRDYFAYDGKLYKGQAYAGGYVPKMTDAVEALYHSSKLTDANGQQVASTVYKISAANNYTNFARKVIGSTLPIGNKNQGFEYQCTEAKALAGTANVGKCLLNGTIKHVKLSLDEGESKWYMICPTSFALDTPTQTLLKTAAQTDISGKYFFNSSDAKHITNLYIDVIYYGFNTNLDIGGDAAYGKVPATGVACVSFLGQAMQDRVTAIDRAWSKTKTRFGI